MNRDDLIWEEVKTEHIVQDEWIDFRRSAYRFPDGTVFEPYYSYSRRDYVVIVASDEEGNYICVRQFRQGIGEVTTEFVAGGLERTDGKEYRGGDSSEEKSAAGSGAAGAAGDSGKLVLPALLPGRNSLRDAEVGFADAVLLQCAGKPLCAFHAL